MPEEVQKVPTESELASQPQVEKSKSFKSTLAEHKGLIAAFIVLIATPLTIWLALNSQNYLSHASSGNPNVLSDTSSTSTSDIKRANSYDDAWQGGSTGWIINARTILKKSKNPKTQGFVLNIGDSITRAPQYAFWTRRDTTDDGQINKTESDKVVLDWMHASSWDGSTSRNTSIKNGWYLSSSNTLDPRSSTASVGTNINNFLSGKNMPGPAMPAITSSKTQARVTLADPKYTNNINLTTIITAFDDAQFVVIMLGTNGPDAQTNYDQLSRAIDKFEAAGIVPILSTIPPRVGQQDSVANKNKWIRKLAQDRKLPLIDFYNEILIRRPGNTWQHTLIMLDGTHPTYRYPISEAKPVIDDAYSDPYSVGGNPVTGMTGDSTENVGYLLRSWLTVQKMKEIRSQVVDPLYGLTATPTKTPTLTKKPTPTPTKKPTPTPTKKPTPTPSPTFTPTPTL